MVNESQTVEKYSRALREAGVKLTCQRLEIIGRLVSAHGHPSVAEVFESVKTSIPTISLDTVYRTMKTLAELGLIHPVGFSRDGIRFDADLTPHHHFLCAKCGQARDFVCPELDRIPIPDVVHEIGTVRGSRVEVRGICANCRQTAAEDGEEE
jgi:Fur family transcriptional regulator, peroxide stress response regulator